ncbi:hypothetical protein [Marimonas arenosa]|uniref:Uncharacterized protein n=1 Tax=Marimonas arenosa TaxID=1795305 RepID=A0AAE4B3I8_9RHOB|nr:hypothetical protein [Marimonas arenosa]MDQ2089270.1 hypothetical protein [Marimonas arenosa]
MNRYAAYVDTLIEADVPILVLLKRQAGRGTSYFFASAMPDDDGDVAYYIVVSAKPSVVKRYFRGQCDLRFLYTYAKDAVFFCAGADDILSERVKLVLFEGEVTEDHLPAPRLFSSSHTSDYGFEEGQSGEEVLFVDGEWEMPEFGDFYSRYSDVYLFLASIERVTDKSVSQVARSRVQSAITSKPFKGGGSYGGLFSDLRRALPYRERPGLDKINYASPGHMEIIGNSEIFGRLEGLVQNFLDHSKEIHEVHDKLRSFLSKGGFLKVNARTPTLSQEQLGFVVSNSKALDARLKLEAYSDLVQISEQNVLVVAKILLAVYRRLEFASRFFAQGRIGFEQS